MSETTTLPPPATIILQSRAKARCAYSGAFDWVKQPNAQRFQARGHVRAGGLPRSCTLLAEPIRYFAHDGIDAAVELYAGPAEI